MGSESSSTTESFETDANEFNSWEKFTESIIYDNMVKMDQDLWDYFFVMEVCDNHLLFYCSNKLENKLWPNLSS